MPFVADEIVTAAKLNMATFIEGAEAPTMDRNGFTNTAFADLDALTGGSGTMLAVIVTATTGTSAKVTVSANGIQHTTTDANACIMSYRISGATTRAASDLSGIRTVENGVGARAFIHVATGLTAGVNVFELQARVTALAGRLIAPSLIVEGVI